MPTVARWPHDWPPSASDLTSRFCRRERLRWNLHLYDVARRAGVSATSLAAWESGKAGQFRRPPTDEWRADVFRALRTMVAERTQEVARIVVGNGFVSTPEKEQPVVEPAAWPSFVQRTLGTPE